MRGRIAAGSVAVLVVASIAVPITAANAAPTAFTDALDIAGGAVFATSTVGSPASILASGSSLGSFPRAGGDYVIMSTGDASQVVGGTPSDFISTNLGVGGSADGNDLTQLSLELTPASGATCLAFDFQFLSEEYPEYVGSSYNDIFTAELGESRFDLDGSQVIAPNNFAYDSEGNFISINTVLGFQDASGTRMDGTTDPLVAVTPIETDINTGRVKVFLSIQDIGDSIYDSAVLVDNFRWLYGSNCERTVGTLTDSDGDSLPDEWETNGIDYDGDGTAEVDLAALGANPQRADLFLEIDWMEKPPTCLLFLCWGALSFAPDRAALQDMVDAFAAAPYTNPNGTTGVTVHIDAGTHSPGTLTGGGNSIPRTSSLGSSSGGTYNWTAFEAVKQANFASLRRDVFHYVVYADRYGGSNSSGISRGIPAGDLIVSDGPWSDWGGFTRIQERGTLMHELGHNLDLKHGGIDSTTYQNDPVYRSVMNYLYQLVGLPPGSVLDYSRGTPFNDWANLRFDGGSIGDLGESAPVIETVQDEELTQEIAADLDAAAVPGDGSLEVLGPNVFGAGEPGQVVHVRVSNPGSSAQEYVVSASVGAVAAPSIAASVAAYSSVEVPVTFDASTLGLGEVAFSAALTSQTLAAEVDSATGVVTGIDTGDPQVSDGLAQDAANAAASDEPPPAVVLKTVEDLAGDDSGPSGPASVTVVSGDAQSQTVGKKFAAPLKVIVKDADGTPLAGEPVVFTVTSGSATFASASSTTVETDSEGTASAALTAGAKTGTVTITAAVASAPGVPIATFIETVLPATKARADLSVAISGVPLSLKEGDSRTVTVTVKNAGPLAAKSTIASVNVGRGLTITSAVGGRVLLGGGAASWLHGSLAAGKSTSFTVTVEATSEGAGRSFVAAATLSAVPDPALKGNSVVKRVAIK